MTLLVSTQLIEGKQATVTSEKESNIQILNITEFKRLN